MGKPNCYNCIYRRNSPGSAHSRCDHPDAKAAIADNPLAEAFGILGNVGRGPGLNVRALNVKGNPHGIRQGWFNWPVNFDPTWLESCDGFKKKDTPMKTFTLQFTIDETLPSGGWENPYQLAIAIKYALENRYAFWQVVDVQPVEKPKPVRKFCVVRK